MTMQCLWWPRFRRTKHKQQEHTRTSETYTYSRSNELPPQCTEPAQWRSHSQSHSPPQTPPSRTLPGDPGLSFSSTSSGPIVQAVSPEQLVERSTSLTHVQQTPHNTGLQCHLQGSALLDTLSSYSTPTLRYCSTNNIYSPIKFPRSHNSRMVRSRRRQAGPRAQEDSPTLPSPYTSSLSFSARLARAAGMILPRPSFLDDESIAFSDNDATQEYDDSGYISALTTPAKATKTKSGSTPAPPIQATLIPAPRAFGKVFAAHFAQVDASELQQSRTAESMCEQRHCLKTKRTCLEHAPIPTPTPHKLPTQIPQLKAQNRRLRRRPRVRESQSFKEDVWMQIAREPSRGP